MKNAKPKLKEVQEVVTEGMNQTFNETKMADIIRRDLIHRNKDTGQSYLTRTLDDIMKSDDEQSKDLTKIWVRTRLQTIIKSKPVQIALLGDDYSSQSLTIKKVNKPMIGNDKLLTKFDESAIGSFRVSVESKEKETKSFEDELTALLDKHGKTYEDLIPIFEKQLSLDLSKIKEELDLYDL